MKLICIGMLKLRIRLQIALTILFLQLIILFVLYLSNYSIIISPSKRDGSTFLVANQHEERHFVDDEEGQQEEHMDQQLDEKLNDHNDKLVNEHEEHKHNAKDGHAESINKVAKGNSCLMLRRI